VADYSVMRGKCVHRPTFTFPAAVLPPPTSLRLFFEQLDSSAGDRNVSKQNKYNKNTTKHMQHYEAAAHSVYITNGE